MNRILFEPDEIVDGVATVGGVRAEHILGVLHGEVGQPLKTGVIGGLVGTSEIVAVSAPGERPRVSARVCHDTPAPAPWIDLVLAPPRPRVMKRLLPQLAALGVGRIVLVGARKVEKDFWGATLLKEEIYRPLLVEGLMQCGATVLPELLVRRNFRRFLDEPHSPRASNHEPPLFTPQHLCASVPLCEPQHQTTSAFSHRSRGRLDRQRGRAPGSTRLQALLPWSADPPHRHRGDCADCGNRGKLAHNQFAGGEADVALRLAVADQHNHRERAEAAYEHGDHDDAASGE